ncbi:hypothetical protein [Acidiphilium acidophilum]|uniref:hypothetical protein n=1 Tax=Acidiphilium acidophilum TaxID=76588 RepID=UPI002E8E66C3|nr:hypothetical protein [Acidiphilium acidophilum]
MTTIDNIEANVIYDSAELSRERLFDLVTKCNVSWAQGELRKLHFMTLFAQSEPKFLPSYDEDTGEIGLKPNNEPTYRVRRIAEDSMQCKIRSVILTELGWTPETPYAPLETILAMLPLDRLQPHPFVAD